MRPSVQRAACLAALGLALAGCDSHAVTRQQVIIRADAICSGTLRAVRADETGTVRVSIVVPLIAREVRQLTALPRPSQRRALLARYLSAMTTELGQWRALAAAQARGSIAASSAALSRLSRNDAPQLAARYGLGDCAAAGSTVGSGAAAATTSG